MQGSRSRLVGKPDGPAQDTSVPKLRLEHTPDGAFIRVEAVRVEAPDELRPLASWARDWGVETRGLLRAAMKAGVPIVRVGRQACARRSDLLALVDRLATTPPAATGDDPYASALASRRGRR